MEFFEALKKKVYSKWSGGKALYMSDDWKFGRDAGINAMIEGLKETIVGKAIKGKIWHCNEDDLEFTRFVDEEFDELIIAMDHIGADGEEVVVLVLRYDKQKEQKGSCAIEP